MTREDRIKCPACSKVVARLEVHFRQSHPDLDPDAYGLVLGIPETPAEPAGSPELAQSADLPAEASEPETETVPPAFDMQAIMSPIVEAMGRQQQVINDLQAQLLQQQKDAADFQQSVVGHLNGLPQLVDRSLTSRLDQLTAEYQQQQPAPDAGQTPASNPAAAMANDPKMGLLTSVIGPLLQRLMAPAPPENNLGGINGLVATIKGVTEAANAIASMQRGPWMEGAKFASDIYYNASRSGLGIDKSADAVRDQIDRMGATPTP